MAKTQEEMTKQYGYINGYEHKERVSIEGFRLKGSGPEVGVSEGDVNNLYLVICLDPYSPIGCFLGRYCIPFVPCPEFHLDKATLAIYPVGEQYIRLEVRMSEQRRFAGHQNDQMLELVYGVQVKVEDCHNLKRLEAEATIST